MPVLDPYVGETTQAEPAYCPTCELRHTRRPDWMCPRCGSPVETDVPSPKTVRAPSADGAFPLGSWIAGALLVVTSGAIAIGFARLPGGEHRWRLVAAAAVLAALGIALLLKLSVARWIAVAVAAAAVVVVAEGVLRERLPDLLRDPLPPPVRAPLRAIVRALWPARILAALGLGAGCLLLVPGRPGALRTAAGALLAAPLVVLVILRALGI